MSVSAQLSQGPTKGLDFDGPLQQLFSFSVSRSVVHLLLHSGITALLHVDLVWTDGLTFDSRIPWSVEEFMVGSVSAGSVASNKPKSSPSHPHV